MSKHIVIKTINAYLAMTIGCLIYSAAWVLIFVPNGIVSGGITGLCGVIQFGTGIPIYLTYGLINLILLTIAFIVLGKSFGIRTVFALIMTTVFLEILPGLNLPTLTLKDGILNPIIASFVECLGVCIMLMNGGSSGGTDIIAMIINKFRPVSMGRVYMIMDIAIIASIMLVPGKTIDDMVYGYIAVIVFSLSLDYIMLGRKSSVQVFIMSEKYDVIADFINITLERGVTALNSIGWYTKQDKKVLFVMIRRRELNRLTDFVKEVDPSAFVTIAPVSSVFGEGFEEIKRSTFRKKKNDTSTQD